MKNCSFSAALNIFDLNESTRKKNNNDRVELNGKKGNIAKKKKTELGKNLGQKFSRLCVFFLLILVFFLLNSLPFPFSLFAHVFLVQSFIFFSRNLYECECIHPVVLGPPPKVEKGTGKRKHCHYKHDVWN